MNEPLYMHQIWLDGRKLMELGKMMRLPLSQVDEGYLVHCALGELFGDEAPKPFSLEVVEGRDRCVLGYSVLDKTGLEALAREGASPLVYETCDWKRLASKPMPESFEEGLYLDYEVRVCPVVRLSSARKNRKAGSELDAFLAKVWEVDDDKVLVEREDVYRTWFLDYLARHGGVTAHQVKLESFNLEKVVRRTQGDARKAKAISLPAATLQGTLEVTNVEKFNALLRKGIGRHKSFGFGMIKLRRSRGKTNAQR